jgi:hypothetical protein
MAAAFTAIGTVLSVIGQMKQAKAAEKAEKARQRQMQLEAMRKKREMIRESVRARAEAQNNAMAQGASGGSGLQGGYGQIQGSAGRNIVANYQDETLSNRIFSANRAYAKAGGLVALGEGVSSLGSVFSGSSFIGQTA